jgi:SET domain-containing protein
MQVTKAMVVTKRSSAGLGLFAKKEFKKGETVIEYIGNRVLVSSDIENRYIFNVNKKWDIDGSPRWNTARYINHSCRPNCEAINRQDRIFIVAKKKIAIGEEITYHYGKGYITSDYFKGGCRCTKCTGQ